MIEGKPFKKTELTISKGGLSDISAIFLLNQENNARPYSFNVLKEMFTGDSIIFKAEFGKKCAGYSIAEVVYDDAEIISIAVDNFFRRMGIGRELLRAAVRECKARGAKRILLEVEETNLPAILLYKDDGFKQISVRHKYYGDNSAIIMEQIIP